MTFGFGFGSVLYGVGFSSDSVLLIGQTWFLVRFVSAAFAFLSHLHFFRYKSFRHGPRVERKTASRIMDNTCFFHTKLNRWAWNFDLSHPTNFKVTQGHQNRHGSIGYLWLPINVSLQPWACLVPFPS